MLITDRILLSRIGKALTFGGDIIDLGLNGINEWDIGMHD